MRRVLEAELMNQAEQVEAYAAADFADANSLFVRLASTLLQSWASTYPREALGRAARLIDLGCGHADIVWRLCGAFPSLEVVAIDGAERMIQRAQRHFTERAATEGLAPTALQQRLSRIDLRVVRLPSAELPSAAFDMVVSNSLLHHLPDPSVFWAELCRLARRPCAVLVMDLLRPHSVESARAMVDAVAAQDSPLLQEDFLASLLASFRFEELQAQLHAARLPLTLERVSERHWAASGVLV